MMYAKKERKDSESSEDEAQKKKIKLDDGGAAAGGGDEVMGKEGRPHLVTSGVLIRSSVAMFVKWTLYAMQMIRRTRPTSCRSPTLETRPPGAARSSVRPRRQRGDFLC